MKKIIPIMILGGLAVALLWSKTPAYRPINNGVDGFFDLEADTASGHPIRYSLYRPRGAGPEDRRPLVVYLDGSSENGFDGRQALGSGLAPAIWNSLRSDFPFPAYAIFLQHPPSGWEQAIESSVFLQLINRTISDEWINPQLVSLTGISDGGTAAWKFALIHQGRWSRLAPVGSGVPDADLSQIGDLQVWLVHNQFDTSHSTLDVTKAVGRLHELGITVRFTLYPTQGRDCWTRVYADRQFQRWLSFFPLHG